MSRRALCLAVKDALQSKFGWGDDQCDVTEEGQPVSGAGELFVGCSSGEATCGECSGDGAAGSGCGAD